LFAEATERYLQNKRAWNTLPDGIGQSQSLLERYCGDCEKVVISYSWSKSYARKLMTMAPWVDIYAKWFLKQASGSTVLKPLIYGSIGVALVAGHNLKYLLQRLNPKVKIIERYYPHHLTHAAFACWSSPYPDAACAVVDGFAESSSALFCELKNHRIYPLKGIRNSQASLGFFYAEVCRLCGFDPIWGEEWKVMGLAAYGRLDPTVYEQFQRILKVRGLQLTGLKLGEELQARQRLAGELPLQFADFAFTGQQFFSDIMSQWLRNLYSVMPIPQLVFGGGCALNSAYNGKITESTPFKQVFVPSAPGDDGTAVGAVWFAFHQDHPDFWPAAGSFSPYLGEPLSGHALQRMRDLGGLHTALVPGENLYKKVAQLISQGKIVGWVQGRAEFGPRALGNRSILADPRNPQIKETLNARVKFREEFRPFAPSILHEFGNNYFENYQESPYMERALRFRPGVTKLVPGAVHVDGTGRVQTVKKSWNEPFYRLLEEFRALTNTPMLVNTSFNIMGKPIIHSLEDALALFFTTGLDALVVEDQLLLKSS